MKWASVYSLRPDWNFAKICHLIFDKLDAKFINPLLSLYFDELYLFSKTTLFFNQLTKKSPVFSQGSSSFYFNVNHHQPAPSKRLYFLASTPVNSAVLILGWSFMVAWLLHEHVRQYEQRNSREIYKRSKIQWDEKSSLQSLIGPIHPMTKVTGFPAGHD